MPWYAEARGAEKARARPRVRVWAFMIVEGEILELDLDGYRGFLNGAGRLVV